MSLTRRSRLLFLGFALLVGILYDVLFWHQELGVNHLIFWAIYLLGLTMLLLGLQRLRRWSALLLLLPAILLLVSNFLYTNTLSGGWAPLFIFILVFLYSSIVTLENPQRFSFSFTKIPILNSIDLPFLQWRKMYQDVFDPENGHSKLVLKRIALGIIIALPILFIFGYLFYQADEIFAAWVRSIDIEMSDLWRIFRTLALALFVGSLFYVILSPHYTLKEKVSRVRQQDALVVSIILLLINILFAVFVFIQFKYLFGSAAYVFANEITFAEYARKGFFELAWIIFLAALILIVIYRSHVVHSRSKLSALLQVIFIAQIGVIAVSALHRMNLYQAEFGYTVLRLYVEWFIYFAAFVLLCAAIAIVARIPFRSFLYAGCTAGVLALTMVSLVNVEYLIAAENIRRFTQENKELDLHYLDELSADVIPALEPLFTSEQPYPLTHAHKKALLNIFDSYQTEAAERDSWREYHLGFARAGISMERLSGVHTQLKTQVEAINQYEELAQLILFSELHPTCEPGGLPSEVERPAPVCVLQQINGQTYIIGYSIEQYDGQKSERIKVSLHDWNRIPDGNGFKVVLEPVSLEGQTVFEENDDHISYTILSTGNILRSDAVALKHYLYRWELSPNGNSFRLKPVYEVTKADQLSAPFGTR